MPASFKPAAMALRLVFPAACSSLIGARSAAFASACARKASTFAMQYRRQQSYPRAEERLRPSPTAGASTIRRLAPAMSAREIQARLCYYSDQLEIGLSVKK
jgi:hypothetical protein